MMVQATESLKQYMFRFHPADYPLLLFGHTEVVRDYWDDYIAWCRTDEGRRYLEGGDLYKPVEPLGFGKAGNGSGKEEDR